MCSVLTNVRCKSYNFGALNENNASTDRNKNH
jgi:hypothetical protein